MIDLLVHGKNGQKAYLDLPVPLKALQKTKDRLGETEWVGWNIRYARTDTDEVPGVNIVLYNNNLAGYGRTDDIRELNLLAYVLDRMNESQRETFEMNYHGLGISTCELIRRIYYYTDEYFEDGVTVYNRPVLYNDYESPYRGDNVEDVLQKEEQEFRHRARLVREHEPEPLADMGIGGI